MKIHVLKSVQEWLQDNISSFSNRVYLWNRSGMTIDANGKMDDIENTTLPFALVKCSTQTGNQNTINRDDGQYEHVLSVQIMVYCQPAPGATKATSTSAYQADTLPAEIFRKMLGNSISIKEYDSSPAVEVFTWYPSDVELNDTDIAEDTSILESHSATITSELTLYRNTGSTYIDD